jgi:UDP-N-acetylglucosamine--N-acetylmuramyl-(pentapeptide) pyrophosphoryl-undecaprenol N-acetylglucosamine transferase
MRVLIAGGGTAGHVFPALALAAELRAQGHEVRLAGTAMGQEAALVPAAGLAFEAIEAKPFDRAVSPRALLAPLVTVRSVSRCRPLVERHDVVVGMGGYVSVPVALAALRSRRPLVLHEQNAVAGLANRTLARPARAVALAFEEAAASLPRSARAVVTGNPVREPILAVAAERERLAKEAIDELDLVPGRRTVVVFGGSQGALHVNRAVVGSLAALTGADAQLVLLAGRAHADRIHAAIGPEPPVPVRVLPFLERMELAYAAADLVVARAGATTVAELAVTGTPSLLIPYPHATGRHQDANARALQRAGGAVVLSDDALDGGALPVRIRDLLDDGAELRAMGDRARAWSRPDAAAALARVVTDAGGIR